MKHMRDGENKIFSTKNRLGSSKYDPDTISINGEALSSESGGSYIWLLLAAVITFTPWHSYAQFAPLPAPANLTTITSPVDPNITISYKVPEDVCTTAFDTQQQYTGWVNVPGEFPTNLFFWFVAAREPTAALTIWINGGPGSSSMFGFFTETGPCEIVERGATQLGTAARDWGWDRASNMLFIDQPNQVGFSYDTPTNGSLDLISGQTRIPPQPLPTGRPPSTYINGTFPTTNRTSTANTTEIAAQAIWHLMQGFLSVFPQYNPPDNSSLGISLFAESYGGKYGPVFAETWEGQNARRQNGSLANSTTLDIRLVALGIVNGCVDDLVQGPYYTTMAVNNSYGLQLLSPVRAALANGSFYAPSGCQDLTQQCQQQVAALDPNNATNVKTVNSLCGAATMTCQGLVDPYLETGRSVYDISQTISSSAPFPPHFYLDYLNTAAVQRAIGSPVNYTDTSLAVTAAFLATGDWERRALVPKLAALLARGVRIGMMYGDRDYICNWLGGEAVSLAIAAAAGAPYATKFPSAGYAPVIVNDSYIGGVVRQFANLSFSRIYQSGHFVPAYQPETAFQVFARIIMGTSVSTGERVDLGSFNTTGPANATQSLKLPPSPTGTCFVRVVGSCPTDAVQSMLDGKGVVINGVWYPASSDWPGATMTSSSAGAVGGGGGATGGGGGGGPVPTPTSTTVLTGLFTATATPQSQSDRRCGVNGNTRRGQNGTGSTSDLELFIVRTWVL
ncbi:Alpha/Beta hydrolase protein [Bombardia bombarda]|uniref:Carboxypeptidase n=1 Tax=Bombardia bombarda TaxID=252184 RepID=A0AA40C8R0_9PEZI|nr:Alpha/Beta hydrolase protein [Bombardia bombarda]